MTPTGDGRDRLGTVVVLFDVDGTLLHGSADTHVRAFADALAAVTGHPDPFVWSDDGITCGGEPLSGRIDNEIVRMCLRSAGLADADAARQAPVMMEGTVAAYRARLAAGDRPGTAVPGVVAVLRELRDRGAVCGLLTGNARQIASAKLSACGLAPFFSLGGFGDEGSRRSELFAGALAEAGALGIDHPMLCYVGDTPLDVVAARDAGVPLVAVATGRFDRLALQHAGAATVLAGYSPAAATCDILVDRARSVAAGGQR